MKEQAAEDTSRRFYIRNGQIQSQLNGLRVREVGTNWIIKTEILRDILLFSWN